VNDLKTSTHALISIGYAAGVALLIGPMKIGQGLTDPLIYVSAIIGGELIDIIDHPLYHLVYQKQNSVAINTRRVFQQEGLQGLIKHYKSIEDKREIKGLLLHNIYALFIFSLLCIVLALFLPGPIYLFVGAGAFLLHMISDTIGDYLILGHIDNWLCVLPQKVIDICGRIGQKLIFIIILFGVIIQISLFSVSFRWAWQLHYATTISNAFWEMKSYSLVQDLSAFSWGNISYIPLIILFFYHLNIVAISLAAAQKYRRELGGKIGSVPFSIGSMREFFLFLFGKRKSFENVYLRMQADQGPWIVFLTSLIVIVLMAMTWIFGPSYLWGETTHVVFLVTPIFLALLFGTMLHTTVGEFGGVWGVFIAWILNYLLSCWNLQNLWDVRLGYQLFIAALVAWVMGLSGGIVLKGQTRMSQIVFAIQMKCTEENGCWSGNLLNIVRESLNFGYSRAQKQLYGVRQRQKFLIDLPSNLVVTPYQGSPILGEEVLHLQAQDYYVPIFQELCYVLCDNRLTSTSQKIGDYGFISAMPRQRRMDSDISKGDMYLDGNVYRWVKNKNEIELPSAVDPSVSQGGAPYYYSLYKTYGELFDQLVTKKGTFRTDIFIYGSETDTLTIVGLTCEYTSTKEYATVEAEIYASETYNRLLQLMQKESGLDVVSRFMSRLYFPRISFWDVDLAQGIDTLAGVPPISGPFSRQDIELIRKSLEKLPDQRLIPSATADLRKKLGILGVQYATTSLISFLPFTDKIIYFLQIVIGEIF